jgi:YegS/Rv2252/BmrU family lipid kinase
MSARAVVITNPAAARTAPEAVAEVLRSLTRAGWKAELLATGGHGDARTIAAYAVQQQVDVVAVFGGDGTTMQAASALVGTDVALGVIPGGTGNLLAGNLRIPLSPARAATVLTRGVPTPFDLGRLRRDDGDHYFAVACGTGMDALVMAGTPSLQKRKWGIGAYMATTLRLLPDVRSVDHVITVDGLEYEASAAMILIANCGEVIPPLLKLRDGIRPDDGFLDVVVVRADSMAESVRALWDLLRQEGGADARVGYLRGREIRIETAEPRPVQLDGDAAGETPVDVVCVPAAVRIMMPKA